MKRFAMFELCQVEYHDPRERRFNAQPNACPACGPRLELWDRHGTPLAVGARASSCVSSGPASSPDPATDPLSLAAVGIRSGKIVAVKGLGGFHLVVAAHLEEAVQRLRALKHREEKPLALMFPSLEAVRMACEVEPMEER